MKTCKLHGLEEGLAANSLVYSLVISDHLLALRSSETFFIVSASATATFAAGAVATGPFVDGVAAQAAKKSIAAPAKSVSFKEFACVIFNPLI